MQADEPRDMMICGLDEAGRGALAGPIVIAAVALDADFSFATSAPGVVARDSKLLSVRQRQALHQVIVRAATCVDVEVIETRDIDDRGINWANTEGFRRLVARVDAHSYIVDGRWDLGDLGERSDVVSCQIRADQTVPCALAAGIVAKVVRDEIMHRLDDRWPVYGWARNTGHGTLEHVEAIRQFGTTPEHRAQFVATALGPRPRRRSRRFRPESARPELTP